MPTTVIVLVVFFFLGLLAISLACWILAKGIHPGNAHDYEARRIVAYWGIFFILMWLLLVGTTTFEAILKLG